MARAGRARPTVVALTVAIPILLSGLFLRGRDVRAEGRHRVVLIRPVDVDPTTAEALARVSGELTAAGFDLRVLPVSRDADPRITVESIGRELDPVAAFAIFPGPPLVGGASTAEIWVSDRLTGRATVQRLLVDPRDADRGAAVLAVHAVELLKASLAEMWVGGHPRRASAEAPAPAAETPGHSSAPPSSPSDVPPSVVRAYVLDGFGIQASAGLIAHPSGFALAWTPALKLSVGMPQGFAVRLGLVGAGETLRISNVAGTARLGQQMATVEFVTAFRAHSRVQPVAALVTGVYRLSVSGTSASPTAPTPWTDSRDQSWAFVAGAGGGVIVGIGDHWAVTVDVQALGFLPRPAVRLGDDEVGQVGRPALVVTAGIAGIL